MQTRPMSGVPRSGCGDAGGRRGEASSRRQVAGVRRGRGSPRPCRPARSRPFAPLEGGPVGAAGRSRVLPRTEEIPQMLGLPGGSSAEAFFLNNGTRWHFSPYFTDEDSEAPRVRQLPSGTQAMMVGDKTQVSWPQSLSRPLPVGTLSRWVQACLEVHGGRR